MGKAKIAYEAWITALGHAPAWHENDMRHQAAWQAVADALADSEDTARLDWLHERQAHVIEWTGGKFGVEERAGGRWIVDSLYDSPRAAIDAARRGE